MTAAHAVVDSEADSAAGDCGSAPGCFPGPGQICNHSVSISSWDVSKRAVGDGKRSRLIAPSGWCDWLETLATMGSSDRLPGTKGCLDVNVLPIRRDLPND
jgi:hypothetical protein